MHNRLAEPIALTLGDTGFTIRAGDSLRVPVAARRPLDAQWAMVRPAGADGRMLGSALEGSIVRDAARGEIREVVGAGWDGRRRFSPLVVNGTGRRLRLFVVSGRDTTGCGCSVAPGDSLRLGYYPLEPGSEVHVIGSGRTEGRFTARFAAVDSMTGEVVFRVVPESLRAIPAPARRADPRSARSRPRPHQGLSPRSLMIPAR